MLLALPLGAFGVATQNATVEKGTLALMFVLLLGLGYRLLLSGEVRGERQVVASVVPWGGALIQTLTLTNSSRLRVPAARVIDHATLPAHPRGYVAALPGRRSLTWDVTVPCQTRGRYMLGPVEVTTSDPLHLFPTTRQVEAGSSVLVLPRWVLLTRSWFSLDGTMNGDQRGERRGESPPSIAGVRTYQPGDAMSRIHWVASARARTLLTKQFDPEVQTTLWLALDLEGIAGPDAYDTEELLVTACASLGMYALQQARVRVGLISSGAPPAVLLPEQGRGQQQRLQEVLADVHVSANARAQTTLIEQIAALDRHLAARHLIVLMTSRGPAMWNNWIERQQRRGLAVCVVHVRSGAQESSDVATWTTSRIEVPVALADPARHDDLVTYLEEGGAE